MAKTIKKLARDYVFSVPTKMGYIIHQAGLKAEVIWVNEMEQSYIEGANAVLEEVVKFMEESSDVNVTSFKAIYDRIEELKG